MFLSTELNLTVCLFDVKYAKNSHAGFLPLCLSSQMYNAGSTSRSIIKIN